MGKISEELSKKTFGKCAYVKIFDALDEEDKEAIREAVDGGASGYVIASALRTGGYKIAHSTVNSHLTKLCACK